MISCCGHDCAKCEAFVATEKNDDTLRAEVAKKWAALYNAPITSENINCTGCKSEGIRFYFCEKMCEVRKCVVSKGYDNCSPCNDYPCANLGEIFGFAPEAKVMLDSMRMG